MNLGHRCTAGLVVALLSSIPLQAQIEYRIRSQEQIAGRSAAEAVEFSSLAETQDFVVVTFVIQKSTEIRAEIDYARKEVKVRASAQYSSRPASLSSSNRIALTHLTESALWGLGSRTEDALASTLNFLDSIPPGTTVDFASVRVRGKRLDEKSYPSLCGITGSTISGSYTVRGQTYTESGQLGPCYSKPNECLGRCGAGCTGAPGNSIQRFTQDCFNHDLCTRATGGVFGECYDEFRAATDDFFFAQDCGAVQGHWTDSYNFKWNLLDFGSLSGKVQTTTCLNWFVTGSHNGAEIGLSASNPNGATADCCSTFTYTGMAIDCNSASGTWINDCSGNGTWTLVRDARGVRVNTTDNRGSHVNPAVRP
jgi:hypothetical protein